MSRPLRRFLTSVLALTICAGVAVPARADSHAKDAHNSGFVNTADSIIDLLTSPAADAPHRTARPARTVRTVHAATAARTAPRPQPRIAVKPMQRKAAAVRPEPHPPLAAVKTPVAHLAVKARPRPYMAAAAPSMRARPQPHVVAQKKRVAAPARSRLTLAVRPQHADERFKLPKAPRRSAHLDSHVATLPVELANVGTKAVPFKRRMVASVLPQPKTAPVQARAMPDSVIVASVVSPPQPARKRRASSSNLRRTLQVPKHAKKRAFKPARGGHGIAIVRPWQGTIPDTYCDLPTGCATAAPVKAAAADAAK